MHVDGFRFDLASVLGRDEAGNLLANAPLLERIAEDPFLRDVKIIAEAWDAAGAYEVGSFSKRRWSEWNGRYRDDVRRFWRGDEGMLGLFASRICGSADIYTRSVKGEAPHDLFAVGEEPLWDDPQTYLLSPRSSVILLARRIPEPQPPTAVMESQ